MSEIRFLYLWTNGQAWVEQVLSLEQIETGDFKTDLLEGFVLKHRLRESGSISSSGDPIFEGDVIGSDYIIPEEPISSKGVVFYCENSGMFKVNEIDGDVCTLTEFKPHHRLGSKYSQPSLLDAA